MGAVPKVFSLIGADLLVGLFGIFALKWSLGEVLLFTWAENIGIGLWALIRKGPTMAPRPFFLVHYGMFCFVHLVFVLFYGIQAGPDEVVVFPQQWMLDAIPWVVLSAALVTVRQFMSKKVPSMANVYGPLVVLHALIISLGFLTTFLGAGILALLAVLLVRAGYNSFRFRTPTAEAQTL